MASKSLGTLTLDLVAKTGGFVRGMDAAERKSAKWRKQVDKDMQAAGKAIGAASAIAVGAMAVWIKSSINTAAEIQNLAKIANTSTTDFQRFAAGSRTVGIENEKLSDILKDVTDRVGDFLVTGGGPMADFFEKVAPMVGVTAEQFRNLSGADALGLYVDTLEKAGANQQEMTFFMEAMASDASALIPLLKNGGKEMKGLADEASELGLVLSEETIKQAKQFNDDLDMLGRVASGVGQQIAGELLPELLNLTDELRDPETAKAAADMAKAIVGAFTSIIEAGRETVQFMQWVGEELAFQMTGIAATDDIIRMERELESLQSQFGDLENVNFSPEWINAITGVNDDLTAAQQRARFLREEIAGFYNAPPIKVKIETETDTGAGGLGLNLPSKEDEEKVKALAKAASDAAKESASARKAAAKAAADALEAIEDEISAIERAAKVWGMEADEVKLYDLAQQGATDTQLAYAESLMNTVTAWEKQKEAAKAAADAQEDINDQASRIAESLLTEEEAVRSSYERRRQIILDNTEITGEAQGELLRRLEEKHSEDMLEINGSYWERYLEAAEESMMNFGEITGDMIEQFSSRAGAAFESMIFDAETLEEAVGGMAESMARSVVNAVGQMIAQWLAYQAVQMLTGKTTQASAAATLTANASATSLQAGLAAFASTAAIPIVGPVAAPAAMAAALAATAPLVGAVSAAALAGMAHDGIDSVPATGTWLLEKGERVMTSQTSAKMDKTLEQVNRGLGGGSGGSGGNSFNFSFPGVKDAREARKSEAGMQRAVVQAMARAQRFN